MTPAPSSNPDIALLDRRAEARQDPDWVRSAERDPDTRYVISRGMTHLVHRASPVQIAFLTAEHPGIAALPASQLLLLGWLDGKRLVLVDLPEAQTLQPAGTEYQELRPLLSVLPPGQAEVLALARALIFWRSRHRHCGVCGAPTESRSAGYVLRCTACGSEFFPRIDPAIIVVVTDGDRVLLGRQASWPPGRFSALAGFVEPGESLEAAVAREVAEETGTRVNWVRYFASQAWPFPASLMLGFHAGATRGPIQLDAELEDARWFDLQQLRSQSELLLPPPFTIARRLIEAWMLERTQATQPRA
jgi:NAD+ diphosphatase